MRLPNPLKISILFVGDICALYAALTMTLVIRYGTNFNEQFFNNHLTPFSLIFPIWIVVFFVAGLYDLRRLRNNLEFVQTLSLTLFVNALITSALFYLIPSFGITPKTNLFIFIAVFATLESMWRRSWNIRASFREGLNRVIILDKSDLGHEVYETLIANPQLGYTVRAWLDESAIEHPQELARLIREHHVNLLVIPPRLKHNAATARMLYALLALGVEVRDLVNVYETVFRKIPLGEIDESWFVDHEIGGRKFYDDLKRGTEFMGALVLFVVLLPLLVLIVIIVRMSSPGPAIYRQTRVGKGGHEFTLYKFRSMRVNAERNGAQWKSDGIRDARLTGVGRLLVVTHLDELPQLWNILRGDLSFVGPRPERPEFVQPLIERLPYYEIRHLVNPGITGWAQLNYRYGASIEDAWEKLQYDIYYLKNRSIILDLAIIAKTVRLFFVNNT